MEHEKQYEHVDEHVDEGEYVEEDIFELAVLPFDYNKKGRRTKCTPELIQEIAVRVARDGSTHKEAALLSGINEATLHRWMTRGRQESERLGALGVEDDDKTFAKDIELPFLQFFETLSKAIPLRKTLLVRRINEAGKDPRNWTANAWLLERMHPDEFGRKTRLEISQVDWREEVVKLIKQGVTFETVATKVGEDEARELFERAGVEVPGIGESGTPDE